MKRLPAQHEIDFRYDEALRTADGVMTARLAIKAIAKRHGLHASFMPKPKSGVSGSGLHLNLSLSKDGTNVFYDASDEHHLSREGYWFIGGIMKHIRAITAVTNPLVNSYKRLVPGYEAPCLYRVVGDEPQSVDPDSGIGRRRPQDRTS